VSQISQLDYLPKNNQC